MRYKEKAILIPEEIFLDGNLDDIDVLYIGDEFCERLLPDKNVLRRILDRCMDKGIKPVLVTPFLTVFGMEKVKELFLLMLSVLDYIEVVVNDWGLFYYIKSPQFADLNIRVYLGRVLVSRYIFPLSRLRDKVAYKDIFFRMFSKEFMEFSKDNNIEGFEFNSYLQLRDSYHQVKKYNFHINFYCPYLYLTTTRFCASIGGYGGYYRDSIAGCNYECKKYLAVMSNAAFKKNIYGRGNTYFINIGHDEISQHFRDLVIDRLIINDYIGKV